MSPTTQRHSQTPTGSLEPSTYIADHNHLFGLQFNSQSFTYLFVGGYRVLFGRKNTTALWDMEDGTLARAGRSWYVTYG
jgi:hypothetical protein